MQIVNRKRETVEYKSEIVGRIHQRAQIAAAKFKACEAELIEIFEQADKFRVHVAFGYSSLFVYATQGLKLSEEVAYIFINVARKVREVPALKEKIRRGEISVSKARRITSVLNRENQQHWLELASQLSKRELRRAQDVFSQKRRRPVSLEEVLEVSVGEFIERHDPLARAKRQEAKGKLREVASAPAADGMAPPPPADLELCPGTVHSAPARGADGARTEKPSIKRALIPAATRHKLQIKHEGRCNHQNPDGRRCSERRFLDVHHVQPIHAGGANDLSNLELLCAAHHRRRHL